MNGDKEDSCAFEMQKRAEADGSVMKRVLYVIQSLGGCNGADRSGIAVMDMLMKRNNIVCDVLELCPVTDTSIEVTGELFRLPKVADTGRFVDRGYINKMKRKLFADWHYTRMWRKITSSRYDLIISNEFASGEFMAGAKTKFALCITHNAPITYSGYYWGREEMGRVAASAKQFGVPVAVSESTAKAWDATGYFPQKCRVIPNCVDEKECQLVGGQNRRNLREKLKITGEPLIVCVASIQYRKGQDVLLAAWPKIRSSYPTAQAYLIGPPIRDSWYAHFRRLAEEVGAGIHLLGALDNSLEYIRAADIFVLPSRNEALPLTILEAMVLGTPVVASDVAGIPEMVIDGGTGLLFSSGNVAQLADQMLKMLNNAPLQAQCIDNADAHYWNHYSRHLFTERWNRLLDEIL